MTMTDLDSYRATHARALGFINDWRPHAKTRALQKPPPAIATNGVERPVSATGARAQAEAGMDEWLAGYRTFERIRNDIETGLIHWVERDDLRCPFRWRQSEGRVDDDESDDWDEAGDCPASTPRICNRGK